MAKRRCFSIDLIESIDFRKLSNEAKNLYFGLMAHADDEGVVINPSIPLCLFKIDENTITELIEKGFLLTLKDLLIIRHWHVHNKIQSSKKPKSTYTEELSALCINNRKEYDFL